MDNRVKRVVIAGGGTAGWMTAAALAKTMGKNLELVLVESDEIGTVGVGEATIPTLLIFHRLLGIKESEFMAATNATFKLGIAFEHWRNLNQHYIHSFGFLGKDCWACGFQHFWRKGLELGLVSQIGDYCTEHIAAREGRFSILPNQEWNHAYHMDASLYAKFLRQLAEQHGLKRIEGKISQVLQHDNGHIRGLQLQDGQFIEGDLFIDCTGFRALLIEQTLHTGYEDWTHWLPCDSAIAVQTKTVSAPVPYTRAIAHEAGWQWKIPLQSRVGNGLVFCSKYWSDDFAKQKLMDNIEGEALIDPRVIKFRTGTRRKHWNKNVVAMGLACGFLEPLESTSIHLIQRNIVRLLQMFPSYGIQDAEVAEYNRQAQIEMENVRDFIVLHYKQIERDDSPFWRHCRTMPVPDSLTHRIELFRQSGKVYKFGLELFGESSWLQVMLGQGLMPEQYHPIVDAMSTAELKEFLDNVKANARKAAMNHPDHNEFIRHYCQTAVV